MQRELVDSRLDIPPLPPGHVSRPRLLAALETARDVPLVLLSAGPGTGKTVLLAEWAQRSQLRVAWLCPGPADNDPARLRTLLESALSVPGDPPATPPGVPPQERLVDFVHSLRGRLPAGPAPVILAIDDAHVLTDPRATELLEVLVRCGHPRLHVVLAARHDPPLPLHRYRLAGHLRELRTADLAMTTGETREMLAAHGVRLPVSALNALAARTEGWAAGVRLAAMPMQHAPSPAALVRELSFDHGGAGEYLLAEVLDPQPAPLRRILIETSFLDEVTRPLADAVTGLDGAGEMLAEFARDNSFVITLDPEATRFRYQRLFAEVLRYLLARDATHPVAELAARAAACLASQGEAEQALYWAARSGDGRHAAALLVGGGLSHAFARRHAIPCAELAEILPPTAGSGSAAPSPAGSGGVLTGANGGGGSTAGSRGGGAVRPDPEIALATAALHAATADARTAARELAAARDAATAEVAARKPEHTRNLEDARKPGETRELRPAREPGGTRVGSGAERGAGDALRETGALVRLMLGMRSGDALAVDEAAASLTGQGSPAELCGAVLLAQASAHFWHGEGDVDELLRRALAEARHAPSAGLAAEVLGMTACVASYSGRPRHAADASLRARRLLREQPGLRTPLSLRLAAIVLSVRKADFEVAARHLRHATTPAASSAAVSADPGLPAACTLWRATMLERSGRPHEAQGVLQAAADPPLPLLEVYRDVILGGIEVRLGKPAAALRRLAPHRDGAFGARADVACAHAHLALDDLNGARQSIRRVLTAASSPSSRDVLVEAMLLGARVAQREHDTGRALDMITNALDMAGTDLVLPFAAARETFASLLARHPGVACRWPASPAPLAPASGAGAAPGGGAAAGTGIGTDALIGVGTGTGVDVGVSAGAGTGMGVSTGTGTGGRVAQGGDARSQEDVSLPDASLGNAAPGDVPLGDAAPEDAARQRPVSLTQREQSVLAYLATSMTAAEIAAELYVSVNTVKTHLAAIYRKLSAGGRREAVRRARELELLLRRRGEMGSRHYPFRRRIVG